MNHHKMNQQITIWLKPFKPQCDLFLSREEVNSLAQAAKEGSKPALQRILIHHALMVTKIGRRYFLIYRSLPVEDILQEGMMGVIHAVNTFQPTKGTFFNHAERWVKRCMHDAIITQSTQRIVSGPIYVYELAEWMKKYLEVHAKATNALLTADEVWDHIERHRKNGKLIPAHKQPSRMHAMMCYHTMLSAPTSLQAPVTRFSSPDALTLEHIIPTSSKTLTDVDAQKLLTEIKRFLEILLKWLRMKMIGADKRAPRIIKHRYGIGGQKLTLREVGVICKVHNERIRQIQEETLGIIEGLTGLDRDAFEEIIHTMHRLEETCQNLPVPTSKKLPPTPRAGARKVLRMREELLLAS